MLFQLDIQGRTAANNVIYHNVSFASASNPLPIMSSFAIISMLFFIDCPSVFYKRA